MLKTLPNLWADSGNPQSPGALRTYPDLCWVSFSLHADSFKVRYKRINLRDMKGRTSFIDKKYLGIHSGRIISMKHLFVNLMYVCPYNVA